MSADLFRYLSYTDVVLPVKYTLDVSFGSIFCVKAYIK